MLEARHRTAGILLAATAVIGGTLASTAPANAAATYIPEPTVQVLGATANSLTIAAHALHATHYKLWAALFVEAHSL